jgi:LysR family hydrogen peroxide-inducible transcriptional activator
MTLNELRYFVAVAAEKNFGRAANKCFVSQPALSIAIQKLEDELDVVLFERGKTEIHLTPIGERLLDLAQVTLQSAQLLKETARYGKNPLQGTLKLGAIFTIAPYLLPDLIPALHDIAPAMPLSIEENLTENLDEALRVGRVDCAILAEPFQVPGIVTDFLYEEPFEVVVPRDHKWATRKSVNVDEIAGENPILLNVGHCFRDQVLDACPELNDASRIAETNSLETIRNMVASGLGISVLPRDALTPKYHNNLVVAIPFDNPVPSRRVAIAYRKSFPRVEAIDANNPAIKTIRG